MMAIIVILASISGCIEFEPPVAEPVVGFTDAQCGFCHRAEYDALQAEGGFHGRMRCTACHPAHPPSPNHTLACEACHGVFHGVDPLLLDCALCHYDPHAILRLNMEAMTDEACAACHYDVAAVVYQHPSKHDYVACSACHPEHEAEATLACMVCHSVISGHYPGLTNIECLRCHPHGHDEIPVVYVLPIPDKWCASCHVEPADIIATRGAGHARVACVSCHPEHPPSPNHTLSCNDAACHGLPHGTVFTDCLTCHVGGHNLRI